MILHLTTAMEAFGTFRLRLASAQAASQRFRATIVRDKR
jgi:hypothetical protein